MLKFKNKKVYFLPQEIFFLNQGLKYPEIVGIMAKIAYPEVIDHAK
jgi:iron complex transport system substrate-binding protein